jgi:hypothetical protein
MVGILLALILWVTILGLKKEEMKKTVRFEPLLPPGMVITNKIPSSILFTFVGPRVLLKTVEKRLQPIRPDLRRSQENTISIAVNDELLGKLPTGVRVAGFYPPTILIRLDELVEKMVPVHVVWTGKPAPGYKIHKVQVIPDRVPVLGARMHMGELKGLDTVAFDITRLTASSETDLEIEIDPELYQTPGPRTVHVRITTTR